MRALLYVGACFILAGCANQTYDADALQGASATQTANTDVCFANARSHTFTTLRQFTDCMVTARGQFVATIKIKDSSLFAAYTQRMNLLGDEADTGKMDAQAFMGRLTAINADFFTQLGNEYQQAEADRTRRAAALAAFGAAMQNSSAQMQRTQQNSIHCTTTTTGMFTNTNCN